ncbi:uncharacterized protein LOC114321728 [Camellia sinensis]|uniref:uncharacterized protein LOC114321728 n=1 Tax=Camellia sinensis TaxID=4442 RepID=UPI001035B3CA|nr:uncharacterized protein LOC114321728 [Camellia sinensis]
MYYDAFKQLKLRDTDLAPVTSPLVGFNSQPEWPMGKIILLVKAGSVVKQVEFWVLKVPSTYNLILGRRWLHAMQAVASTYHQVIRAEEKAVEELVEVRINTESPGKFFLLGSSLAAQERTEMVEFLVANIEVFAWTPYDMPGIDPSFFFHQLNVFPNAHPVIQRIRRSALNHTEVVAEEVKNLMEARAI